MEGLVEEAVRFVAKHLNEIISLPIDMNCMNSSLIKKLSSHVPLEELD